jgi:hypothetical protein
LCLSEAFNNKQPPFQTNKQKQKNTPFNKKNNPRAIITARSIARFAPHHRKIAPAQAGAWSRDGCDGWGYTAKGQGTEGAGAAFRRPFELVSATGGKPHQ